MSWKNPLTDLVSHIDHSIPIAGDSPPRSGQIPAVDSEQDPLIRDENDIGTGTAVIVMIVTLRDCGRGCILAESCRGWTGRRVEICHVDRLKVLKWSAKCIQSNPATSAAIPRRVCLIDQNEDEMIMTHLTRSQTSVALEKIRHTDVSLSISTQSVWARGFIHVRVKKGAMSRNFGLKHCSLSMTPKGRRSAGCYNIR